MAALLLLLLESVAFDSSGIGEGDEDGGLSVPRDDRAMAGGDSCSSSGMIA